MSNAAAILLTAPLTLSMMGYECAYHASLEKMVWDWEHSPAIVNLRSGDPLVRCPKWHTYVATLIGTFWGALFFAVSLTPYAFLLWLFGHVF